MPRSEKAQPAAWASRPWAATLLRVVLTVGPLLASVAFVWLASRWFPAPHDRSLVIYVLWWLALSAAGSVVLLAADRAGRRLLPLAALLRLSLVFPDAAPSRFRAALQAGKVRRLEDRLQLVRNARGAGTPNESAQRLLTLVAALSEHDRLTRGHSERVRAYAVMIGEEMRLGPEELDLLNWAALLHDVGKLDVAGEILRKPGRPTETEWEQLKRHPLFGEKLVAPMAGWLGGWTNAVGYHHERWDGEGYPRGVAGDEIPLAGRIVAIADVFDVITSARSYKAAGSATGGREEIARCAGTQFDPRVVRAFLNVSLGRMRLVMGPLSWLAHTPVLARLPLASTVGSIWSAVAVVAVATGLVASESTQPQAVPKAAVANARAPADRLARTPAPPRARMVRTGPEAAGLDAGVDGSPAAVEQPPADPAPAAPRRGGDPITGPPVPPVETMTVNDPPAFDGGPDQVVREDSGARTVAAWATGISPGPASESGQSTEFRVNSDAPTLFGQEPRVRPDGTLTFATAPDASGVATVTVRAVDNGGTENGGSDTSAPQTFAIAVTPANDPPAFAAGPDEHVLEDAGAQTVVGWATQVTGGPADEASQSVSFEVTNDEPGMFSAQPRVEPDGSLTYAAAADASGTATVTVRAVDSGGTADGGDATSRPRTFAITVVDVNDLPSFAAGPDQSVLEGAGAQTVAGWATATSPGPLYESGQAVSFSVGNDNPGLFSAPPQVQPNGTLTYTTAAGASGLATVTVQAVDNGGTAFGGGDTSPAQTFTIAVTAVNSAPSFTAGPDQSVLEDAGARTVPGWATGISAGPGEGVQSVTFGVSNDTPGLFSAQPQVQPDGTLTYTPAANASGVATVTVRALDDGGTALGGSDTSAPQTLTITVAAVNDVPAFSAGANQLVLIDSGPHVVGGWATGISAGPGEGGQTVGFSVSSDNPGLFSAPPQVQPNGTLTYTPAAGVSGLATVTVRAVDDGGTSGGGTDTSAPQTFTIEVATVNSAPGFTAGPDQSALEDGGARTVSAWATGISPGPPIETGQAVTFNVSNSNPALFSAQPQIQPNGTLSYTPAGNASGAATVTVRAVDDGGTAFGGVDTSAPQTFTIIVTEVNDAPSFTSGGNQTSLLSLGGQTIAGWASGISPGPASEAGQSVSFVVSNSNTGLFSSDPQIQPNGTLSYTPALLTLGSATVTVRAVDNGGTANSGIDTSPPQTFTITIIL